MGARVDVLVPTRERTPALAVTLAGLAGQSQRPLRVVISDQSERPACDAPEVAALVRVLRARGVEVQALRHLPRRGMAEQRAFLLEQAQAPYCLFLDDDVWIEPGLIARLHAMLVQHGCGFAGSAVHGLSHVRSVRPHHHAIDFWEDRVAPELVVPGSAAWERHHLHSAANLFHVQGILGANADAPRAYRVAWVGGCVLFDTAKLRAAGGFDFWPTLPPDHCGEDVLAQLRVMARDGGCGVLPSGAFHLELPTTIPAREVNAPHLLWPPPDPAPQSHACG